jgi:high-affinity Fe2+/Pb2+ permease
VLVVAAALAAEREWSAAVALTVGLMVGFASGAVVAWGLWGRR